MFQKRYIHKKGRMFWGQVSNSIVKDHDEKPMYFVTHFMDITENKKNEEALQKIHNELESRIEMRTEELSEANDALRESETKYRSMMESFIDPLYICSPEFAVEYMNPAMVKRIGRDATGEMC